MHPHTSLLQAPPFVVAVSPFVLHIAYQVTTTTHRRDITKLHPSCDLSHKRDLLLRVSRCILLYTIILTPISIELFIFKLNSHSFFLICLYLSLPSCSFTFCFFFFFK